ncbi:MAG: DNA polymerase III subunit gamma/tau [Candidatus Doudnabacteria bacterium]|nr:DNA polymerase III subunit gamma/tau [Candidatus Doudnabacteria bacterium]
MSEVLYRKYRPRIFAEVLGQDVIKTIIQNALKLGRVSHAYLFAGPRGVGKTTVARLLAKAVNCLKPKDGEPDTVCANCKLVQEGRFLDLIEIDAASYTGVDNIREIIEHVKFTPSAGKYKVFIIDEVHMLSKAAFNALLKTLEEPPAHAIFILATTEIHKVPATIISRSQRFDFKRVSQADILQLFKSVLADQKADIPLEAQKLIAQAAEGSFRDALSILDQVLALGGEKLTVDDIEDILGIARISTQQKFLDLMLANDAKSATQFVKDLAFAGKDLTQFTRNFLEYLRQVLFVKMNVESVSDIGLVKEEEETLIRHAQEFTGSRLLEFIKGMLEAYRESKNSPVAELPLLSQVLSLASNPAQDFPKKIQQGKPAAPAPDLDLGIIVDRWAEVLARVKDYNHSLLSSLRLGRLVKLEGVELTLAFPYNFHKETIEARKNRIVVEQVLEDIFQKPLKIKVQLERELEKEGEDLLSEAVKVLGQ